MRRVVATGLGVISPLGCTSGDLYAALLEARSAIRLHDFGWGTRLAARVETDVETPFPKLKRIGLDRVTLMALLAVRQAVDQSGGLFTDSETTGLFWGTGMGGATTLENSYRELFRNGATRLRPTSVVATMTNAASGHIGIDFGVLGPSFTYSSACSSSAVAIGEALRALRTGTITRAIVGGSEALLTQGVMMAWDALQTIAHADPAHPETSCRPFSADRTGFVLGEGASALILETEEHARARGATCLAELVGYGNTTDARHITQPDPSGQARAIRQALTDACLAPEAVQHVNAHGTGTRVGDANETRALHTVFGIHAPRLAISATKALHGHLMGATGALEVIATIETLRHGEIPPTAHLREPDPACDLDYVREGRRTMADLDVAMSNSFGFGGNNVSLVLRRYAP